MTEMVRTKVLLAGDAAARPAGLVATLEQAGFEVEETPAGSDLAAAAERAAPDAVLLCVSGPGDPQLGKVRQLRHGERVAFPAPAQDQQQKLVLGAQLLKCLERRRVGNPFECRLEALSHV